jgi:hypothetical protein
MLIFRRGLFGSLCQFSPAARKRQRFPTALPSIPNRTLGQARQTLRLWIGRQKRRQDAGATGEKCREHYKTIWRLYRQFMWQ